MSEQVVFVVIDRALWDRDFATLATEAERATVRLAKAPAGDRSEAVRYENICRSMERFAMKLDLKLN